MAVVAESGGFDGDWGRDFLLSEYGVDCDVFFGEEGACGGGCHDGEFCWFVGCRVVERLMDWTS